MLMEYIAQNVICNQKYKYKANVENRMIQYNTTYIVESGKTFSLTSLVTDDLPDPINIIIEYNHQPTNYKFSIIKNT